MANYTGSSKGKIWISKDDKSTLVYPNEFEEKYKPLGWYKGHITDNQKSKHKQWYNNGLINMIINEGEVVPNGYVKGMLKREAGGYSKFEYVWYTNGVEQKRLSVKLGDTIPEGWHKGYSDSYKEHMSDIIKSKGNFHLNNKGYSNEYLELYHNYDKLLEFVKNNSNKSIDDICDKLDCTHGSFYSLINTYKLQSNFNWYKSGTSSIEQKILDYLNTFILKEDIKQHDRTVLDGKEIDIYIPKYKIGIELNGTYWHSGSIEINKHYHENKSKLCEEKGIRLIHIYEWELDENFDKIKSLLNISLHNLQSRIYARKCEVRKISNKEAKLFNDKNHLQNHRNAQVTYGLYYNDELQQLMSFSQTKYNRNLKDDNSWEIIRGCPGSNNQVVGGVSKLFKAFVREYNPSSVFSYCDFNKFDGKGYEALGMKFIGYTGPDKNWIINGKKINRNPFKYKELKKSAELIVWGAGSKKYLWTK